MQHVLYNIDTLQITNTFKSERGAKISWTRRHGKDPKLAVADSDTFHNKIDHDIEVTNLLSGRPTKIRKSQKGGCCDPSTERYHCM